MEENPISDDHIKNMKFAMDLISKNKKVRKGCANSLTKSKKFSEQDFVNIHSCLMYSMWMSDGEEIQQEIIDIYSNIIFLMKEYQQILDYINSFFKALMEQWSKIDYHRVNKYYSLVRKSLNSIFTFFKRSNYDDSVFKPTLEFLYQDILVKKPSGVSYHIFDILLQELHKTDPEISSDHFMIIFYTILKTVVICDSQGNQRSLDSFFLPLISEYNTRSEKPMESELPLFRNIDIRDLLYLFNGFRQILDFFKQPMFDFTAIETMNFKQRNFLYKLHEEYVKFCESRFETVPKMKLPLN